MGFDASERVDDGLWRPLLGLSLAALLAADGGVDVVVDALRGVDTVWLDAT